MVCRSSEIFNTSLSRVLNSIILQRNLVQFYFILLLGSFNCILMMNGLPPTSLNNTPPCIGSTSPALSPPRPPPQPSVIVQHEIIALSDNRCSSNSTAMSSNSNQSDQQLYGVLPQRFLNKSAFSNNLKYDKPRVICHFSLTLLSSCLRNT